MWQGDCVEDLSIVGGQLCASPVSVTIDKKLTGKARNGSQLPSIFFWFKISAPTISIKGGTDLGEHRLVKPKPD